MKKSTRLVLLAIAILVLHLGLVLRHYPMRVLTEGEIPLKGDVSRYFATAHGSAMVDGIYGYDPYFMAGYPVGLWNSMGKKGFEVAHAVMPWLPLPTLFYVVLIGLCVVSPLVAWLAVRGQTSNAGESVALLVLFLLYWHLCTMVSYFWGFGNVFFPATSCLLIALIACVWQMLGGQQNIRWALASGALAALIFYFHTVVLLAAVIPLFAIMVLTRGSTLRPKGIIAVIASVVVFLALVSWWLLPLLRNAQYVVPQPREWFQAGLKEFVMDALSDRVYRHHFDRNFLVRTAIILGIAGGCIAWRKKPLVSVLAMGGLCCVIFAYTGSNIAGLRSAQPYRFLIPATLMLLPATAVALTWIANACRQMNRTGKIVLLLLALLMLPAFTGYLIDLMQPRTRCGVPKHYEAAFEQIRSFNPQGRILCDDIGLGHLVPYECTVPVIGGLSAQAFLQHRFAGMDDEGVLFGKAAAEWEPDELGQYLRSYAVEYAIFRSRGWREYADSHQNLFEKIHGAGWYSWYRVKEADTSLVLEGKGKASATYGGLQVTEVGSESVLLKLHYVDWMKATDGVTLSPEPVLNDPVPFIRAWIPSGVTSFSIRFR